MADDKKHPHHLLWIELETTGLDPREDHILELAFILTEFHYPYDIITRGHYLVNGPGRQMLLAGECGDFIQDMHGVSGLRAALEKAENTTTLPTIESDLLALSERWPGSKDEKVVVAGNSVHFDLGFLRHHMPSFAKRLSYRVFDVRALELARRTRQIALETRG
jgi:oligoribonuclease